MTMIDWKELKTELGKMIEIIDLKEDGQEFMWWQVLVHDQRDKLLPLLGAVDKDSPTVPQEQQITDPYESICEECDLEMTWCDGTESPDRFIGYYCHGCAFSYPV